MNAPTLQWRGDNLALGYDVVTVQVVDDGMHADISIEKALRRIDDFDAYGRDRILKALPYQFDMIVAGGAA